MKNSTIKQKIGICLDCGKERNLTAGRCGGCYWPYRNKVNSEKQSNKDKKAELIENAVFFASQILEIPKRCENCGDPLIFTAKWTVKAAIAHIVPKAFFKSVRVHPLNRWFGCVDCHTNYDNKGEDYQASMPVNKIVVERFKEFCGLIPISEARRLPVYLKSIWDARS